MKKKIRWICKNFRKSNQLQFTLTYSWWACTADATLNKRAYTYISDILFEITNFEN